MVAEPTRGLWIASGPIAVMHVPPGEWRFAVEPADRRLALTPSNIANGEPA